MVVMECWWRLFDVLDYKECLRLAGLLECQLIIPDVKPFFEIDKDGYQLLRLYITSQTETMLLTFANTANVYGHLEIVRCQQVERMLERAIPSPTFVLLLVDAICRHNHELKYGAPVMKYHDHGDFDWTKYRLGLRYKNALEDIWPHVFPRDALSVLWMIISLQPRK